MDPLPVAQLASAIFVVVTPCAVANVAFRVACGHARAVGQSLHRPGSVARLDRMTMATAAAMVAVALAAPSPAWVLPAAGLAFAGLSALALRALGDIDRLSKPLREVTASLRSASLSVRRAGQFLPWKWRFAVYAVGLIGVAAFAVRLASLAAGRRLLVPVTLAAASVVFLWIYEVWIQGLVSAPTMSEEHPARTRQRFIRGVFAMEAALVVACLTAAHLLLDLDWRANAAFGALISLTTGALGVVGCALAVSSDLARREYARMSSKPS
jgi:hypothetical protein